ncbi:MAG: response regulator [candidate division Zixibacteria bacterium]|jgi:two-component system chemotaxis response regulator CheY|nr:response regulator [candidate division Zixibacteria bacterium]NIR63596.1 response regulator [candidate division Zixibacteria bacterium]NIS15179.1 response regulator [candidate division Zixibacteria bacterium]NIS45564.1 response regulator [candidate division Zixibacteria bacterium]NIT51677.1 response regulator [candidate division Zixibacteria bacterium]
MRRIIINTLRRAGFSDVVEASDGRDALEKMKEEDFNCIITDWNMPKMDGLTFVNNVRSMKEFESLPILMVTTRSVEADIEQAMKTGVNSYIVKPFTPDTLVSKIKQIMQTE